MRRSGPVTAGGRGAAGQTHRRKHANAPGEHLRATVKPTSLVPLKTARCTAPPRAEPAGRHLLVGPGGVRRHRQQDGLGAPARLQAKVRASIPHQVELHIAAPAVELKGALALAIRCVLAPLHDGQVGRPENASPTACSMAKLCQPGPARRSRQKTRRPRRAVRCGVSRKNTRRTTA